MEYISDSKQVTLKRFWREPEQVGTTILVSRNLPLYLFMVFQLSI